MIEPFKGEGGRIEESYLYVSPSLNEGNIIFIICLFFTIDRGIYLMTWHVAWEA